ncbi:MAG: aminoglycoside phosphotransferase family protein [bacterium]
METVPQQPVVPNWEKKSPFEQVDLKKVADSIHEFFPKIKTETIELLGEGTHSWAFLVNDEYVFRFAQSVEAARNLRKEMMALPIIGRYTTLPIPQFEYIALDNEGKGFSGYKCIPGKSFTRSVIDSLSPEERKTAQDDLKQFFQEVHSIPLDLMEYAGVRLNTIRRRAERAKDEALPAIAEFLTPEEIVHFRKMIEEFLGDEKNFSYKKTFLQGDANPSNVRFEETSRRVAGVIDWGNVTIDDPLFDFVRPYLGFGKVFTEQILPDMSEEERKFSMEKIRKMAIFLVIGSVHYTKDVYGNAAAVKRVERLRRMNP